MRRWISYAVVVCLMFGFAGTLAAQEAPAQVSRVFYVTPKSGMEMQFEAAVKQHVEWHRLQKDTWRWDVRFTETGSHSGEYIFVASGHTWADFDKPVVSPQADGEHYNKTMAPFVASWSSLILRLRTDLSRGGEDAASPNLSSVTFYNLKYGQTAKFVNAMRQIREALEKTNAPARTTWFQVVGGGRNAIFVSATARANWAAFELTGPSPRERVEQVFGRAAADSIYQNLEDSIAYTESKISSYRPDLSYVPAAPR